jgi:hypothetical protein
MRWAMTSGKGSLADPGCVSAPLAPGQQFTLGGARLCRLRQPQQVDAQECLGSQELAAAGRDAPAALRFKMKTAAPPALCASHRENLSDMLLPAKAIDQNRLDNAA